MTDTPPGIALADALLDVDDHLSVVEALKPLLAPTLFTDLCERLEVCPVHVCDERICADDDDTCAAGRPAVRDPHPSALRPESSCDPACSIGPGHAPNPCCNLASDDHVLGKECRVVARG